MGFTISLVRSKNLVLPIVFCVFLFTFLILSSPVYAVSFTNVAEPLANGFDTGVKKSSIAWGDYDNDGDLDLAVSGRDEDLNRRLIVFENQGGTSFVNVAEPMGPDTGLVKSSIDWGDYDNDGDLDLVVSGEETLSMERLIVFENQGGTSFVNVAEPMGPGYGLDKSSIAWGDYDNDGDLDLATSGETGSIRRMTVFENQGGTSFVNVAEPMGPNNGIINSSIDWGDYDNDGDLDLAVSGRDSNVNRRLVVFENQAGTSFVKVAEPMGTDMGVQNSSIRWADYDNDGDLDLGVSGYDSSSSERLIVFENQGGTSFVNVAEPMGIDTGLQNPSITWGDFDNEGNLDLAVSGTDNNNNARLIVFENQGGTSFVNIAEPLGTNALKNSSIAWGDYDLDGDLDLAASGQNNSNVAGLFLFESDASDTTINMRPPAPSLNTTDGKAFAPGETITLDWSPVTGDDHTPGPSMTYNLRVGTAPDSPNIVPADPSSDSIGRRILGNVQNGTFAVLQSDTVFTTGTYYWAVQALDGGQMRSNWSAEQTFEVKPPVLTGQVTPSEPGIEVAAILDGGVDGVPSDSNLVKTTTTDQNGNYSFFDLPPSPYYQIEVAGTSHNGNNYQWRYVPQVSVPVSGSTTKDIALDTGGTKIIVEMTYKGDSVTQGNLDLNLQNETGVRNENFPLTEKRTLDTNGVATWNHVPTDYSSAKIHFGQSVSVLGDSVGFGDRPLFKSELNAGGTTTLQINPFPLATIKGQVVNSAGDSIPACWADTSSVCIEGDITIEPDIGVGDSLALSEIKEVEAVLDADFHPDPQRSQNVTANGEFYTRVVAGASGGQLLISRIKDTNNQFQFDSYKDIQDLFLNPGEVKDLGNVSINTSAGEVKGTVSETTPIPDKFFREIDHVRSENAAGVLAVPSENTFENFRIIGLGPVQPNGQYSLSLASGEEHRLLFANLFDSDGKETNRVFSDTTVFIPNGDTVNLDIQFNANPGDWGTLKGSLSTLDGAKSLWHKGVGIFAINQQTQDITGFTSVGTKSPEYKLEGLPSTDHKIVARTFDDQGEMYLEIVKKNVSIPANGTKTLDLEFTKGAEISGVIEDKDGNALEDVQVTVEETGQAKSTSSTGNYSLTGLKQGTYTVRADTPAYVTRKDTVSVSKGGSAVVDLQLSGKPATIQGFVENNSGEALTDLPVQAIAVDTDIQKQVQTSGGTFVINSLPPNEEYSVVAEGEALDGFEYDPKTQKVLVGPNETKEVDFTGSNNLTRVLRFQSQVDRDGSTLQIIVATNQQVQESGSEFCDQSGGANSLTLESTVSGQRFIYNYSRAPSDTEITLNCSGTATADTAVTRSDTFSGIDVGASAPDQQIQRSIYTAGQSQVSASGEAEVNVSSFGVQTSNSDNQVKLKVDVQDTEAENLDGQQVSDVVDVTLDAGESDTAEVNSDVGINVTISYDEDRVDNPDNLQPKFFDETDRTWKTDGITDVSVDEANAEVDFTVSHLTEFAITESTGVSSSGGDDGTCMIERSGLSDSGLQSLRNARDWMMSTSLGRWIIQNYYSVQ